MEDVIEYKRVINPVIYKNTKWFPILHSIEITYNTKGVLIIKDLQCGNDNSYLVNDEFCPNICYSENDIRKIFRYWNRWSDNDCRVGNSSQEVFARSWINRNFGVNISKSKMQELRLCDELIRELKEKGFFCCRGFEYGTKNNEIEQVPMSVIEFLFSLPNAAGDSWNDIKIDLCSEDIVSENDFNNLLFI